MPTKLTLKYQIISGPYGNVFIQTKIDGEPEELPFKSIYLKESPKEVLKHLIGNYLITEYLDINPALAHSPGFGDISEASPFTYKEHLIQNNGFSIQHSRLVGVTINNSVYNDINLSFLPKRKLENKEQRIKELIEAYLVVTNTKYGPIIGGLRFEGDDGIGPRPSYEEQVTKDYFKERKKSKDAKKEKQLSQILEYAQVILNKPKFSIKNLEEMVYEKVVSI